MKLHRVRQLRGDKAPMDEAFQLNAHQGCALAIPQKTGTRYD